MSLLTLTQDMPLFPIDARGFYHIIISLIISQRVRFNVGRAIRKRIYELQGRSDLNKIIELTKEQRQHVKLPDNKWTTIQTFHQYYELNSKLDIASIPGIGPWTVHCAQIMSGDYSCGFITTDLAVRKWVSRELNCQKLMSQKDLKNYIDSLSLSTEDAGLMFSKIWNYTRDH